jgi:hypothetical protein
MADDETPTAPAGSGGRRARLFLTVAGGLAAPMLALAAFFLSNSGGSTVTDRPVAKQAGRVTATTATTAPARPSPPVLAAPATSTTTVPARPPRDPFAPLVTQAPPGGTPAH